MVLLMWRIIIIVATTRWRVAREQLTWLVTLLVVTMITVLLLLGVMVGRVVATLGSHPLMVVGRGVCLSTEGNKNEYHEFCQKVI